MSGHELRLVKEPPLHGGPPRRAPRRAPGPADVGLVALLFGVASLPVAGELAGVGRWSPGTVGFAAGAALLAGRELWSQLRRRGPRT